MTKPFKATVVAVLLLAALVIVPAFNAGPQRASAAESDKGQDQCTGHETSGRCADKCPNWTDTLLGFTDDGVAICKAARTGCPYGDSVPLEKCEAPKPEPVEIIPTEVFGK